jgi:hypothetical protein
LYLIINEEKFKSQVCAFYSGWHFCKIFLLEKKLLEQYCICILD